MSLQTTKCRRHRSELFFCRVQLFTQCSACFFFFFFFNLVCTFQFNLLTVSSMALLSLRAEEMKVGDGNVKDLQFGAHPGALIQLTEVEIINGGKWSTHTSIYIKMKFNSLSLIKVFSMSRSSPHLHTASRTTFCN